jgi:ribonuclease E
MTKRMLIDATHPEETRVVVVSGNKLEELDFEVASRRPIKGNIFLAKVTRVEPSLQAAFVEYGGNRHGFLAFSEIHPDYYRIPVSDREALEMETQRVSERAIERGEESGDGEGEGYDSLPMSGANDALLDRDGHEDAGDEDTRGAAEEAADEARAVASDTSDASDAEGGEEADRVEQVGGDEVDEVRQRRPRTLRQYKIQEVVKRRQIMLVQVTKEERGNKGAALTTFLSLPGRYCVLMPNTPRGGGVSRKITNTTDRKRLKEILDDLNLPDGMSVILRTAGMERSKQEIRRDLDYLLRLWDSIRERTLESTAPELIYEEGNLIKRSVRDLYSREIDEIWVEGDAGYRAAKDFMRMVMPSHARKVQNYKDDLIPLFMRHQVESQIDAMHNPVVQLKSGGYIVLNQTEALVAIDVNSGRATRERNIEETATKTNLEAADEVARQLRLRDLAGLVVIDFIDMEEQRNNLAVERRLKEAMKADRARIQIGRISPFGLMELSRQRLRPSLMETHFTSCPHCQGLGLVRSVESAAMEVMRAVQEEGIRRRSAEIAVTAPTGVVLYLLNQLRPALSDLERRYAFRVLVTADDTMVVPAFKIDRLRARTPEEMQAIAAEFAERERQAQIAARAVAAEEAADDAVEDDAIVEDAVEVAAVETKGGGGGGEDAPRGGRDDQNGRRRRRRRRRRGSEDRPADTGGQPETFAVLGAIDDDDIGAEDDEGDGTQAAPQTVGETSSETGTEASGEAGTEANGEDDASAESRRKRRRGKRGGRRRRREQGAEGSPEAAGDTADEGDDGDDADAPAAPSVPAPARSEPAPGPVRIAALAPLEGPVEPVDADDLLDLSSLDQPAEPPAIAPPPVTPTVEAAVEAPAEAPVESEAKPRRPAPRRRKTSEVVEAAPVAVVAAAPPEQAPVAEDPAPEAPTAKPRRVRKPTSAKAEAPVAEVVAAPAPAAKAKRPPRRKVATEPVEATAVETAPEPAPAASVAAESVAPEPTPAAPTPAEKPEAPAATPPENARRGWWNRG